MTYKLNVDFTFPFKELELTPPSTPLSDRVEVIKLPATNGSPSGISSSYGSTDSTAEVPLNLSLKPCTSTSGSSSSLTSLSNMSANIGSDRICKFSVVSNLTTILTVFIL